RKVYASGLGFPNQIQCEIDWWIFWGRVAGGLNRNQQIDLFQRLSATLLPRAGKKVRVNNSLLREMWRTASSLELLPLHTKTELGDALVKQLKTGDSRENELWCLSRLGARQLLYGPINQALPPSTVTRWVEALLPMPIPQAGDTLAALARLTGDPMRDVNAVTRDLVRARLEAMPNADRRLAAFNGEEVRDEQVLGRIFGEELPSGLVLG
ncbi:MAG: molecular chaperone DnaK, partial [Bryobacteraceae bacterium]